MVLFLNTQGTETRHHRFLTSIYIRYNIKFLFHYFLHSLRFVWPLSTKESVFLSLYIELVERAGKERNHG